MNALRATKLITLRHPEHEDVTETVEILDWWFEDGKNVGYVVEFASGVKHLYYHEVRQLKQGEDPAESAELDIAALMTNGEDGEDGQESVQPFHPRRCRAHPLAIKRFFVKRALKLYGRTVQ